MTTFPHRLLSSLFEIQLSVARIKEYQIYKDERRDPNARDIFWGRVETLRLFLDKVFTTSYYENISCELIVNFFLVVFQLLLREVPLLIDDILTTTLDGLLRTNIRKLHKSRSEGSHYPIFLVYQHILMNHTTKLIHTSKYLEKYHDNLDLQHLSTTNSNSNPNSNSNSNLTEYFNQINQLSFPPLKSNYQKKKQNYYNRIELSSSPTSPSLSSLLSHSPPPSSSLQNHGVSSFLSPSPSSLSPMHNPSISNTNQIVTTNRSFPQIISPSPLNLNHLNSHKTTINSSSSSSSSLPPIRVIVNKQIRR